MRSEAWLVAAVDFIARQQERDGAIPWWTGSELDPWDHVECAMALDVVGRRAAAERAYRWLAARQLPDGAFGSRYRDDALTDATRDTNLSTYLAVGVWHHWVLSRDRRFLRDLWPAVERAIGFALSMQAPHGGIWWAADPQGRVWPDCLVTGSSSVRAALLCAERIAEVLGEPVGERWRERRLRLERALRDPDGEFGWSWRRGNDPKERFAMDWYYPVLCGVVRGAEAHARLDRESSRFVRAGLGCRCRDDQPWVTVAESAELALALDACGRARAAREILEWQLVFQDDDGGFRMGTVPDYGPWPDGERPTWTAAAVVLAADALYNLTPAGSLFRTLHEPGRSEHPAAWTSA